MPESDIKKERNISQTEDRERFLSFFVLWQMYNPKILTHTMFVAKTVCATGKENIS